MNRNEIIKALTAIGERQLEKETEACSYILQVLECEQVAYHVQEFTTDVPVYGHCTLVVDGEKLEVLPSGLVSGTLLHNHTILSSLISSQKNIYDANINFNPLCEFVSRSNHYFAPAFSIKRGDVQKVINAKQIIGKLEVTKTKHQSKNILVGNTVNPTTIIFSHYDSISVGAVDNTSGSALSLELIVEYKELANSVLFVLCGTEELSYDQTIYWGHGYRCFENEYGELLKRAVQILVLDSLGHTSPIIFSDVPTMKLAFPIVHIATYASKTKVIAGNIDVLMQFYHAENDIQGNIKGEYLDRAKEVVLELL